MICYLLNYLYCMGFAINMPSIVLLILMNVAHFCVNGDDIDSLILQDPTGWTKEKATGKIKLVDPTGWNYDRKTKNSVSYMNEKEEMISFCNNLLHKDHSGRLDSHEVDNLILNINRPKATSNLDRNVVFVRRFVGLLLETAGLPAKYEVNKHDVSGVIEVKMTALQFEMMSRFSKSNENISFGELDSILSNSIHNRIEPYANFGDQIEKFFFMASQKEVWLLPLLILIVLFTMKFMASSKSVSGFIGALLLLIFCSAYVIEYYKMYKEVEIKQRRVLDKHKDIPQSCLAENQPWLYALWYSLTSSVTFDNNECEKYYKAILLDPIVEVSPVKVLSHIIADFVLGPVSKAGDAIADFSKAILGQLPVQYGWCVWIISSLGAFSLLVIVASLLAGGSLHLGGLFASLSISSNHKPQITSAPVLAGTDANSRSQPLLGEISETKKYILMDAESLKTFLNQPSVGHHNRIQELSPLELRTSVPSKEPVEVTNLQKSSLDTPVVETEDTLLFTENYTIDRSIKRTSVPCKEPVEVTNLQKSSLHSPVVEEIKNSLKVSVNEASQSKVAAVDKQTNSENSCALSETLLGNETIKEDIDVNEISNFLKLHHIENLDGK